MWIESHAPSLSRDLLTLKLSSTSFPETQTPSTIKEGIPFDMKGVELGHHGDKCSFDAFMEKYNLQDPALKKIQLIVREADTHPENPSPLAVALDIFGRGYTLLCKDDYETLEKEFYLYDALYAYFKENKVK